MTGAYSPALRAPSRHLSAHPAGQRVVIERTHERVEIGPALAWEIDHEGARDAAWDAPRLSAPPEEPRATHAPRSSYAPPSWRHRAGAPLPTSVLLQMRAATRQFWR